MDGEYTSIFTEEERAARRAQRVAARKKKNRARRRRQFIQLFPFMLLALVLLICLVSWVTHKDEVPPEEVIPEEPQVTEPVEVVPEEPDLPYSAKKTAQTAVISDQINSVYGIVVDVPNAEIVAEKSSKTIINPASMTKVLTLLVAAEQITNLDDTYTMTIDITDYCYVNDCSVVGYQVGEIATIKELLYGVILPSGADASLAIADYVAGSHEAFVELMNQKLEELGLSETAHFTNCIGLYDESHYCTVYDMAMILKAAMENELCREILNARTYPTAPTQEHPDGQLLSNLFLRRIEDRVPAAEEGVNIQVVAGKTGYVVKSGSCAASCGRDAEGNEYIVVTGDAEGPWKVVYDHEYLYKTYCK